MSKFIADYDCGRIINLSQVAEFCIENNPVEIRDENLDWQETTEFAVVGYLKPRDTDANGSIKHNPTSDYFIVDYFDNPCNAAKYLIDLVGDVGGSEHSPIKLLANGKNRWGYEYNPKELERYKKEFVEDVQLDFL